MRELHDLYQRNAKILAEPYVSNVFMQKIAGIEMDIYLGEHLLLHMYIEFQLNKLPLKLNSLK